MDHLVIPMNRGLLEQEMIRGSGLFNVDSKLNKYVSVGGKLSYSNTKNLAAAASGSLAAEVLWYSRFGPYRFCERA